MTADWELTDDGTLQVRGDLVYTDYPGLALVFAGYGLQAQECGQARLDLTGVTFIDSAGLALLVRMRQRCPALPVTLRVQAGGQVDRSLQVTTFDRLFTIERL